MLSTLRIVQPSNKVAPLYNRHWDKMHSGRKLVVYDGP